MAKKFFVKQEEISEDGFRYRGLAGSRLENLTDAVFGFSITLLVISSQVPTTYIELQASMYSFIGFIFCTMLLLGLWNNHSNFFLHYGLKDTTTKLLNALYIFMLLFYIYPLKYLFSYIGTGIYATIKRNMGDNSEALQVALTDLAAANLNTIQWKDLIIRFGLGLLLIYLILMLMHVNAIKKAKQLNLSLKEEYITKTFIREYFMLILICVLSILVVVVFGGGQAPLAGFVYLLTPIVLPLYHRYRRRKGEKIELDY